MSGAATALATGFYWYFFAIYVGACMVITTLRHTAPDVNGDKCACALPLATVPPPRRLLAAVIKEFSVVWLSYLL